MQKYIVFILLLAIYIHPAQQKKLTNGRWSVIGISGIYNKKRTTDNNSFPFTGNALKSSTSVLIDDVIDFNSSNNNVYSLYRNSFSLSDVDKYTATNFLNSRIDVYRMSNKGTWDFYSSKNLSSASNDFTKFEIGRAYWVKATTTKIDNNISIILDNHLDVLGQYSLRNGWNVVSLNDDIIEHSASAFFIPETTTLPLTISRIFNLSPIVINGANIIEAAQSINHQSFLAKINGEPLHLRAYPARKTNGTEGIIVISNSIMNVSALDALSLSGDILQNNPNGYKISNIEHIIGFKIDTTISNAYNSMLEIIDLAGNSGTVVLQNININNMTNTVVSKVKEVLKTNNVMGYTVMIDFNGTTPVYDNILISSDKPFGIKEKFYARKFKYLREGKFFVSGADAQALSTPSDINKFSRSTGITYHNLGMNKFEISSNRIDDLDLFKSDSKDLFQKLDNDNKGYITNAYKAINFYGAFVKDNNITPSSTTADNGFIDEVTHINDLSTHAIYSESVNRYRNLQKFFLLDKEFINLYTAEFINGSLLWRTIDFTKPSNWFDKYDKATLFVSNKELGYYAYLKDKTSDIPVISNPIIKMKVKAHFNSKNTYNFVNYIISFQVNNLSPDKRYIAYMVASNQIMQIYDNNGKFEVKLDNEFLKLDKDKKYNISIKIANNTGALVFNQKLSLMYNKPIIKSAKITGNILNVTTNSDYEIYDGKINEANKKETFLGKNITDLSKIIKKIDYKNIKVVAMDKYGFYSDIYSLGYVPDNEGSTLRVDNERRNRVTLKIINNSNMTLTFTPVDDNKLIITVARVMYLKVGFKLIGSVTYDLAHKNNKFFVFYDDKRYEGIFQSSEDYSSDGTAYVLQEIK